MLKTTTLDKILGRYIATLFVWQYLIQNGITVFLNGITLHFVCVAKSFMELVPYLFTIERVTCFLSEKLSQDALEKFFGSQRQKGRTNDNPTVIEFLKNTKALRVIDSISVQDITGNCL